VFEALLTSDSIRFACCFAQLKDVAFADRAEYVPGDDSTLVRTLADAAFDLHGLAVHPGPTDEFDYFSRCGAAVFGFLCAHANHLWG
jgi:hypothetical protein